MRKPVMRSDITAAPDLPFSHAILTSGPLLFIAGQGPVDPLTGTLRPGTFEEQARLTLDNLAAVAKAGGTSLANAVKVNAYLRDMSDFAAFNKIYLEYFDSPRPARTTVQSDLPGFEVEIDAVVEVS